MKNITELTIEEAKNIGFERMMSSKAFVVQDILTKYSITQEKYDRLFITASMYYFLLFNYWYVYEVLNKIDLNSICLLEISKKIKLFFFGPLSLPFLPSAAASLVISIASRVQLAPVPAMI